MRSGSMYLIVIAVLATGCSPAAPAQKTMAADATELPPRAAEPEPGSESEEPERVRWVFGLAKQYATEGERQVALESALRLIRRRLRDLDVEEPIALAKRWNVEPLRDPSEKITRWRSHLIEARQVLDGERVASAQIAFDPKTNRPEVVITLDAEGAKTLAAVTEAMVGQKLAVVFEQTVFAAPVVEAPIIGGKVVLAVGAATARDAQREAEDLATILRLGALPAPLELVDASSR